MRPLEGITVVALEQAVAAPFATRQLADFGARVIKIERPDVGDFARGYDKTVKGMSSYFVWVNRSKESLTLDIKHPEATNILHGLLDNADVFIQNLAPGATDRLGFDAATLRARYPRLIICNLSGYGSSGPYRDKKAYDLLIQCETGVVSVTGTPEVPSKAGISIADISAGMYAYAGILTALYQRERTGAGSVLEVSLFESLGEWMSAPGYFAAYGGQSPRRTGASHATIAPYGPFTSGDGQQVNVGIQNEREWKRFCEIVLARPELATDPRFDSNTRRVQNRVSLHEAIDETFSTLSTAHVIELLDSAQIANARMNSPEEFWSHPQLTARDRWRNIDSPVGQLAALLPPITMDDVQLTMAPVPGLGEHTGSILGELGYDAQFITMLRGEGAI